MDTSFVSIQGLSHSYMESGSRTAALNGIGIEIIEGQFVSVIGRSGCGKTTLLKCIAGLIIPSSGTVSIDGSTVFDARQKKTIGYVFQDSTLFPWLNVIDNISLPLKVNRYLTDSVDPVDILKAVGLLKYSFYYPHQLSGGMLQRVSLARGLITRPKILLMDEPLGSLDEITRADVRQYLMDICQNTVRTVVMVTHSILEAVMTSDRVVVLSGIPGEIVGDISIDLPRPRKTELENTAEFQSYCTELRRLLFLTKFIH